jgi:Rrf2 family protein
LGIITQVLSLRYALQSLVYLAKAGSGRYVVVEEVARKSGMPPSFLAKVLRGLVEKKFLYVRRGPNGGYALARPAGEIRIADVFEALSDSGKGKVCLLKAEPCLNKEPCAMHQAVVGAEHSLREGLERLTLASLAAE